MNNPFEAFPWNDSFVTGIPQIDEQHQILVQFLNTLASSLAFHADMPSSRLIFKELSEYAVYHFQTEESIWHQYFADDPWEADHKKSHNDFIAEVNSLKEEETSKPLEIVLENVVSFLTHWLAFHILESDKRLAKVVLAVKSGMSLEQAKQHANQDSGLPRLY
jgi:hemerythrin-like metal-binding protein